MKRITKPKAKKAKEVKKPDEDRIYTREELEELLKPKMKNFCRYYIEEYNATASYLKSYGEHLNYHGAGVSAHCLLKNHKIKQYIEYVKADIAKVVGISKIGMLKELKSIATANLPEMYEDWITRKELTHLKENHPQLCKAIKEISSKTKYELDEDKNPYRVEYVKVLLHDKLGAIEKIFKAMGWNEPEKINMTMEQPLFPDLE